MTGAVLLVIRGFNRYYMGSKQSRHDRMTPLNLREEALTVMGREAWELHQMHIAAVH